MLYTISIGMTAWISHYINQGIWCDTPVIFAHVNIAVNTRLLLPNRLEGIGRFSHEVLSRLVKNHPEVTFHFLFDRPFSKEFIYGSNVVPHVLFPPARHPLLFYWWFEWSVAAFLKKFNPDVFLSPDGYLSLRSHTPQIAVIHDLNFEHRPQDVVWYNRWHFRYYFPRYAAKAKHIITVSEFSKQDIAHRYSVLPQNISVVYNGLSDVFKPSSNIEQDQTRAIYSDDCPYFLFWGAIHPRKNIETMLLAFEQFKSKTSLPHKLVLCGTRSYWTPIMQHTFENISAKSDVIFHSRLPDNDLQKLIAAAQATLFVSHFEGFGLPIIESQACGTPVIAANNSSMPEVGGSAALYIESADAKQLYSAMIQVCTNETLRNRLIAEGYNNCLRFKWDRSAEKLWTTVESTLASL